MHTAAHITTATPIPQAPYPITAMTHADAVPTTIPADVDVIIHPTTEHRLDPKTTALALAEAIIQTTPLVAAVLCSSS